MIAKRRVRGNKNAYILLHVQKKTYRQKMAFWSLWTATARLKFLTSLMFGIGRKRETYKKGTYEGELCGS
jgi:hypothetical protein